MSKFPAAADYLIEIQGSKTKSLFDTGGHVSCISYDCYSKFILKTKIDMTVKAKGSSADGSNLGPIGVVLCTFPLGTCECEHMFIVCKYLLCPLLL